MPLWEVDELVARLRWSEVFKGDGEGATMELAVITVELVELDTFEEDGVTTEMVELVVFDELVEEDDGTSKLEELVVFDGLVGEGDGTTKILELALVVVEEIDADDFMRLDEWDSCMIMPVAEVV